MDQDLAQQDELNARRDAMRERLRQKADRVLEAVEQIEAPKTFLEVERAARAIIATDKMIIQIFSAPKVASLDMRFGAADYGERERSGSGRLPVERAVDAPIVASGDTSPVSQGKMVEVEPSSAEIKIPASGRLTKRQKRRQRAFTSQGPSKAFGAGLGP